MNESMKEFLQEQRRMEQRREAFGSAAALSQCRFDLDSGQVPQLDQARNYVGKWKEMYENSIGLMFWGPPGSGKTFAAACIANALMEQPGFHSTTVKMTTLGTILNNLPGMTARDKEWYLQGLLGCDLLILDDFGMERRTEYAREQIFGIIDSRYLSRLPLIITTNLTLEELKHPADMAERRIYDRVREMCVPVCFDGESLRSDLARQRLKRYKDLTGQ